ncbi:hypothetical protein GCM10010149_88020 [Nonomuraea roseoviolacea subsp. roseoviolacea]
MATRRVVTLSDDLDKKSVAIDTVEWGYGKKWYNADVNEEHQREFYDFMERWVSAGRVVPEPSPARSRTTVDVSHAKVRAYCKAQGIPISDSGRPSVAAIKAYVQAWLDETLPDEFR